MPTDDPEGRPALPDTAFTRAFGLRLPLVNAPMGGVAGGRLAAAVIAAGGLGTIGMGSAGSAAALRRELDNLGPDPGPFGIGLVDWVVAADPELLEVALAAAPALITVGFGVDRSWVARAREAGIRTAAQVYTAEEARRAEGDGIDVLVARGAEGGGHGAAEMATLPLLDAVLGAVSVPVLAAGGIAAPASLAAVLTAGASGAWLGTYLAACEESSLPEPARTAMIAADGADTVLTTAFDAAIELPWPTRFPARVLRNDFTRRWPDGDSTPDARAALRTAIDTGDMRLAPVDAGQGVGAITAVVPVARAIGDLCAGAARLLEARHPATDTDSAAVAEDNP